MMYLADKAGQFYPAEWNKRSEVNQWLFFGNAGVGPMQVCPFSCTQTLITHTACSHCPPVVISYARHMTQLPAEHDMAGCAKCFVWNKVFHSSWHALFCDILSVHSVLDRHSKTSACSVAAVRLNNAHVSGVFT